MNLLFVIAGMTGNCLLETSVILETEVTEAIIEPPNHLAYKQTLNHSIKLVECLFTNLVVVGLSPVAVI